MVLARFHLKVASGLRIVELSQTYLFLFPNKKIQKKKHTKKKTQKKYKKKDVNKVPIWSGWPLLRLFWAFMVEARFHLIVAQGSRSPDFGAEIRPHSQC